MADNINQFLQRQHSLLRRNDLESVLKQISDLFRELGNNRQLHSHQIACAEFDSICQQVGKKSAFELLGKRFELPDVPHHVIALTEIVCQGGHSELVRDIIRSSEIPVLLAVSNINHRKDPLLPQLIDEPNLLGVIDADNPSLLDCTRTLQLVMANPQVKNIYLLMHGYDSAINATVSSVPDKNVYFIHHCDHHPALGCYLAGAQHIDLHNIGFFRCRNEYNISDNKYIALSSMNLPAHRREWIFAKPKLKTATCGATHKLHTLPYHIEYRDLVINILKARNGVHFHIGRLTDMDLQSIYNALAHFGFEEEQFIYLGEAPNLARILNHLAIDIYIPTLPQSGGKALIDAMAAGIPILAHQNARDRTFGSTDLIYPEAPTWANFNDLKNIFDGYDENYWKSQVEASSNYFRRFHAPELFIKQWQQGGDDLQSGNIPGLKPWWPETDFAMEYIKNR